MEVTVTSSTMLGHLCPGQGMHWIDGAEVGVAESEGGGGAEAEEEEEDVASRVGSVNVAFCETPSVICTEI